MTIKQIQERNPYWSSYMCFAEWVKGKKLEKGKLRRAFFANVEKGDYLKSEQDEITDFLIELNYGNNNTKNTN